MPLNTLLLVVEPWRGVANTLSDHIDTLGRKSRHKTVVLQNYLARMGSLRGRIQAIPRGFPLEQFDVLLVHYSNYVALESHVDVESRQRIRSFKGLKAIFIQDEYRTVDATVAALRDMEFDILFTCVPESEIEKVYPAALLPGLLRVPTLTGFVPEQALRIRVPPIADRPVDVGYRSRVVPFWLGELGAEKWRIVPGFMEHTKGQDLNLDLSFEETSRLYGKHWTRFMTRCKSVLGVESGASVFDYSGQIQREVDDFVAVHPGASFEEVHAKFLKAHEGKVRLNQISPRAFEAAALRTAQVLFEGQYSGILEPGRHYIPLRKDFSNIAEVVGKLKDPRGLQKMVDLAYSEVALDPRNSYQKFVIRIDDVLEAEFSRRNHPTSSPAGPNGEIGTAGSVASHTALRAFLSYLLSRDGIDAFVLVPMWQALPHWMRWILRPIVRLARGAPREL